ncbi:RidA family protein [Herbaspirillum rhizosphaerae]|uniref:RidA family protein n=1 Tax=Herbaspirillum rhizosphaerae TaxID=346179 RepID=UPI00067AD0DD|nr:RidA family protein [Herbaspirillum rhizosphaerae]
MTDAIAQRQWMPLDEVGEPFRTRLLEVFHDMPRTHAQPAHFDLSNSSDAGNGRQLWISGQVPRFENVVRYQGVVGLDVSIDTACDAARLSLINLLSILAAACGGDLSRVDKFIRLTGYVRSTSDFSEHAKVIDAASEIINAVFGERGRHVRSAIGVASLPGNASVELECVVQLKPPQTS